KLSDHIDVVLKGKGAMMPPFAAMLSATELAAVITYQRNAFGNDVGDLVQPAEIAPLIQDSEDDEDDEDDE
ncbi:MAG: c-type cytochrome, partial [Gammaproteobacteria bacterium]